MRISELVKRLEIPQSSTSTLMKTLVAKGLVEFDPDMRTFCPSVRLAFLGNWVLGANDGLAQLAFLGNWVLGANDGLAQIQSLVQRLSSETGETVLVGAQNGLHLQYLLVMVSPHAVRFALRPGSMRPLHRTGLGLMLMTTKEDGEVGRMIRRHNSEVEADQPIVREADVIEAVREARSLGYCETANLATPGAGVIATLLPLPVEGRHLAIGLGAPLDRIRSRRDELRMLLRNEVIAFGNASDPFNDLEGAITGVP